MASCDDCVVRRLCRATASPAPRRCPSALQDWPRRRFHLHQATSVASRGPPSDVICTALAAVAAATQISSWPDRFEWKAIRLPSGEELRAGVVASRRTDLFGERCASGRGQIELPDIPVFDGTVGIREGDRACRDRLGLATSSPTDGICSRRPGSVGGNLSTRPPDFVPTPGTTTTRSAVEGPE